MNLPDVASVRILFLARFNKGGSSRSETRAETELARAITVDVEGYSSQTLGRLPRRVNYTRHRLCPEVFIESECANYLPIRQPIGRGTIARRPPKANMSQTNICDTPAPPYESASRIPARAHTSPDKYLASPPERTQPPFPWKM